MAHSHFVPISRIVNHIGGAGVLFPIMACGPAAVAKEASRGGPHPQRGVLAGRGLACGDEESRLDLCEGPEPLALLLR
jgi:hypothetical protein